jgi:hypothetical protein
MNTMLLLLGVGAAVVGGAFIYAYAKDSRDPFGVLKDMFNDTFVPGGKFIVPDKLIHDGVIIPENLDFKKPIF